MTKAFLLKGKQLWATKKSTVEGHRKALQIEVNPIAFRVGALGGSVVGCIVP